MSDTTFVFFDFDNTLTDHALHGKQYVTQLARLLAYECGNDQVDWVTASAKSLSASIARYDVYFANHPLTDYNPWLENERSLVVDELFTAVGLTYSLPEPKADFAKRLQFDALVDCNAIFPGIAQALHSLFGGSVRMQMASSQESDYLLGGLMGGGIESMIESKFGPDLVGCAKEGPEFYTRVFTELGITPEQAIVVDDLAVCLDWASQLGARTLQVRFTPLALGPELASAVHTPDEMAQRIRAMIG